MKSIFFTIVLALLFAFEINAIKIVNEDDKEFYMSLDNVKRNIKFNGERVLDVYYDKNNVKDKKRVVIHIFGGSWIQGDKINQVHVGNLLETEGYVAVLPNYALHPNGTVDDMVEDIYKAIHWTYNNISKYGGNPKKLYLSAHSAGAHVAALTIVKAALHLENNGVVLKDLPKLKRAILLNGPYIFDSEFLNYTLKGTLDAKNSDTAADSEEAALLQQLVGIYYNNDAISPIQLLKAAENNSVKNKFNVNKFIFLYTSEDTVIPESSSKNLIAEILRTSQSSLEYVYEEGYKHDDLVNGVKREEEEYEEWFMDLIRS